MLGSILSNILLVLGCSFLAAGTVRAESVFQVTAAQAYVLYFLHRNTPTHITLLSAQFEFGTFAQHWLNFSRTLISSPKSL